MKYIHNTLLVSLVLLAGLLTLPGCDNREKPIFDKPALERAADLARKCETTLLSSKYGWEMAFKVPSGDLDVMFHAQLKFEEGKKVTIWTDYLDEPVTSSYKMSFYEGATLVFDTPGALTELANPAIFPNASLQKRTQDKNGYFGENDFVIVSVSDDKIVLRGLKHGFSVYAEDIVLTPLDKPASLSNNGVTTTFNTGVTLLTYFGEDRQLCDGKKVICDVAIDAPEIQHFIPSLDVPPVTLKLLDKEGKLLDDKVHAVTFTYKGGGIHLTPAIEYEGKSYADFIFDEDRLGLVVYTQDDDPADLWINLSLLAPVVPKLRSGGQYTQGYFVYYDADPILKKLMDEEKMKEVIPGYVTMQWYLYEDLKEFDYFRKTEGGDNEWPGFTYKLEELSPGEGIYRINFGDPTHDDVTAALTSDKPNGVNIFGVYFTTLGMKESKVKIEERDAEKGIVRLQEQNSEYKLWIEFKFIPNE